jgi:CBS domain-containing protein
MQVKEIMTQQVQACRPEASLESAAQLMWDYDCGWLPVCTGDGVSQPVGVVTDRDICMCALFQGKPLRELRVSDAMAREILSCRPEDSLEKAERAMRAAHIRRLPVIDGEGGLVGVLSLADLAREATRERTQLSESEVNMTYAAICEPNIQTLHA